MGKRSRNPSFSNTVNNPRGRRSRTASEGDNQAKPSQPGYMGRHSTGAGGGKHGGEICLLEQPSIQGILDSVSFRAI